MSENKHLTLDERNFIEQELAKNTSFREIAKYLSKNPTTISREVKKTQDKKRRSGYYRALPSFNAYKTVLVEARQGINMTELELSNLDKKISPLIKQGQSISHIHKTNDLPCSIATLYNYVSKNCFSARNIDLPRLVKMKKRKQRKTEPKNTLASYQKGMIEKNHEFIRYVLPKGTSFDNLLQTDVDLMINHINSLGRASLNWFAPIDIAKFTLDKDTIKKLNLKKVPANEIQLNKKLLKKN